MTGIDWVIVAVVLFSVVLAAAQGFLFEVFSLAGVVLGYLLAAWEYWRLAPWFAQYVKTAWVAEMAAFVTIFFGVLLLAGFVGRIARWLAHEAGLRLVDRLLGAVFGLLRGLAIVAVLVLALAAFAPGSRLLAGSRLGEYFLVAARGMIWVAPASVRQRFYQGVAALRKAAEQGERQSRP